MPNIVFLRYDERAQSEDDVTHNAICPTGFSGAPLLDLGDRLFQRNDAPGERERHPDRVPPEVQSEGRREDRPYRSWHPEVASRSIRGRTRTGRVNFPAQCSPEPGIRVASILTQSAFVSSVAFFPWAAPAEPVTLGPGRRVVDESSENCAFCFADRGRAADQLHCSVSNSVAFEVSSAPRTLRSNHLPPD